MRKYNCRPHYFPTPPNAQEDSSGVDPSRYAGLSHIPIVEINTYRCIGVVVGIAVGAAAYSLGRKLVVDKTDASISPEQDTTRLCNGNGMAGGLVYSYGTTMGVADENEGGEAVRLALGDVQSKARALFRSNTQRLDQPFLASCA